MTQIEFKNKLIMTQIEFEKLVQVTVSEKEYAAIKIVYVASDLDKFEFCDMWVKMNKSRVNAAKKAEIERLRRSDLIWKLGMIYLAYDPNKAYNKFATDYYTKSELKLIQSAGIGINQVLASTVNREINQILREAL